MVSMSSQLEEAPKGMCTFEDAGGFPPCDVNPLSHHMEWYGLMVEGMASRSDYVSSGAYLGCLRAQDPFCENCPPPPTR